MSKGKGSEVKTQTVGAVRLKMREIQQIVSLMGATPDFRKAFGDRSRHLWEQIAQENKCTMDEVPDLPDITELGPATAEQFDEFVRWLDIQASGRPKLCEKFI